MDHEMIDAEKIVQDIENAFSNCADIDEFDVIPMPVRHADRSPVVVVERKLGLELWCLKSVYEYAYRNFTALRQQLKSENCLDSRIFSFCRVVLLLNANDAAAWNFRKECLHRLSWTSEMQLCSVIIKKHSKSSETFWHRKWLILQGFPTHLDFNSITSFLENEMKLCDLAADRYPSNYNAWTYRCFVLEYLKASFDFLSDELCRSRDWTTFHVSDYSGLHYRQFLINRIRKLSQNSQHFAEYLRKELSFIDHLLADFSEHEALWCHRKYVLFTASKEDTLSSQSFVQEECSFLESYKKQNSNCPLAFVKYEKWFVKFVKRL